MKEYPSWKDYRPNFLIRFFLSNTSKSLYSCPVPRKSIGFPVMLETDIAVPPFSSTSALDKIIPVISIDSLNAFACSVASFPVMDSPRNIFISGLFTLVIFSISCISESLFCILPAVSIKTTSILFFLA